MGAIYYNSITHIVIKNVNIYINTKKYFKESNNKK